ncbi:DgyrCDS11215 [Dimorphilus gyrociliatus]|uniref:DgyrCDS11215 n=1 Tax=Dimorphilus gyrociliatus TaxID=2664684 RepID=A0A7I8W2L8_9ANNE|nr:DgyrCDS11215 [Dimorphilus gyrociliatus]
MEPSDLPPIKSGRDIPFGDTKGSTTPPVSPLPPIGQSTNDTASEFSNKSSDGTQPDSKSSLPKVLSFKREITDKSPTESVNDRIMSAGSRASKAVSFAEADSVRQIDEEPIQERFTVVGLDGNERFLRSIEIQTEWTIKEDNLPVESNNVEVDEKEGQDSIDRPDSGKSRTSSSGESPWPHPREDEFGIPMLTVDESDSSDDSFDEDLGGERKGTPMHGVSTLPSVGPPQALQYKRESSAEAKRRQLEKQTVDFEAYNKDFGGGMPNGGMFSGQCEFCSHQIRPPPTLEEQRKLNPESLYCCSDYRDFVHLAATHPLIEKKKGEGSKISVKPHPPYGSKKARDAAKERAAQRMRERELARQQAALAAARGETTSGPTSYYQSKTPSSNKDKEDNSSALSYNRIESPTPSLTSILYGRQQCTINYQLSSEKCFERGWTLKPPSPILANDDEDDVWQPELEWYEKNNRPLGTLKKFYKNGQTFLLLLPDGSGNVFYPNGATAISRIKLEDGLFSYLIHSDDLEYANLLGYFEPNGCGATNYLNGKVRLCLNAMGGMELDIQGGRKRRWFWKVQPDHVHAPPIQPITFAITNSLSIRVWQQDNISLTFRNSECSCRFQVGSKLVCRLPEKVDFNDIEPLTQQKRDTTKKVNDLLSKVATLLKFPKSPRLGRPSPSSTKRSQSRQSKSKGELPTTIVT